MAKNTILSFGLVSIEVKIDKATDSLDTEVKLDSASPDKNPVAQVYEDKVTGDTCEKGKLLEGRFVGDEFHEVSGDTLDEIKDATKLNSLDLDFAPLANIDLSLATGKHYVTPKTGYEQKLRLLMEAMKKSKMAFVAKWVPVSRQALVVGFVENDSLALVQVPYAAQIREAPEVPMVKIDSKQLDMAVKLIKATAGQRLLTEAEDDGVKLKAEAIEAALAGKKIKQPDAPKIAKGEQSIEDLLEASLNS